MTPVSRVKVAVLNADPDYCSLLKSALDSMPRFHPAVVLPSVAKAEPAWVAEAPEVVLLDISVSSLSPFDFVRALKLRWPETAFVVLTDKQDEASILGCLRAGASGYLLKDVPLEKVCRAVDQARDNGFPMSPRVARRLAEWFHARELSMQPSPLSAREQEIVDLLAEDAQNKDIASILGLSEATVRAHLRRIYEKLHVHSRAEVVASLHREPS
jgi:DNA-binding NarL/FixJ family response regulator